MEDKNDYMPVAATDILRIASREDANQGHHEKKNKKREEHKNIDIPKEEVLEDLDTSDLVEFGRIVFNKRNTELKLFQSMQNEEEDSSHLQVKIAEYEKELHEFELKSKEKPAGAGGEADLESQVANIEKLYHFYQMFYESVLEETRILNLDDIGFLDEIIRQKEDILTQITLTRADIDFDIFKSFPEKNEKKIKANEILADIHSIINKIMRQEDENSVELQSIREKMKLIITKQDQGAKVISQYAQASPKSHFIDKKS